jgi:hypothetical protein
MTAIYNFNISRNVKEYLDLTIPDGFAIATNPIAKISTISAVSLISTNPTFITTYPANSFYIATTSSVTTYPPTLTPQGGTPSFYSEAGDCYLLTYTGQFTSSTSYLGFGCAGVYLTGGNYNYDDYKTYIPFTVTDGNLLTSGKVIASAALYVTCTQTNTQVGSGRIAYVCEAADTSVNPSDYSTLNLKRVTTAFSTNSGQPIWTSGTTYAIDITTSVQEVINRAGWGGSNNRIGIIGYGSGGSSSDLQVFASYEAGATKPYVIITY